MDNTYDFTYPSTKRGTPGGWQMARGEGATTGSPARDALGPAELVMHPVAEEKELPGVPDPTLGRRKRSLGYLKQSPRLMPEQFCNNGISPVRGPCWSPAREEVGGRGRWVPLLRARTVPPGHCSEG